MADNPAVPEQQILMNVLHTVMKGRADDPESTFEVQDNTVTVDRDELITGVAKVVQQVTYDYQQGKFDDGTR
jgi:hypothetical protein